jgi:Tfp pilus assembly protein PilF
MAIFTATVLSNIGMCHSLLGNFSKASVFFAASLCLEPHSLKSYYQLCKSMMESESVEEAFVICKGAISFFT